MTISDKNTRKLLILPIELKDDLERIAKKENRSFNNLIVTVLKEYRDKIQKEESEIK